MSHSLAPQAASYITSVAGTTHVITHNLNSLDIIVSVFDTATFESIVPTLIDITGLNSITIEIPIAGNIRGVVLAAA